jgi:hypothetical protein
MNSHEFVLPFYNLCRQIYFSLANLSTSTCISSLTLQTINKAIMIGREGKSLTCYEIEDSQGRVRMSTD